MHSPHLASGLCAPSIILCGLLERGYAAASTGHCVRRGVVRYMDYHVWALRRFASFTCLISCLCLLLAAPLRAEDAPPGKNAQYRELIEKALQEYALGHWPEARVFFSDAHALWPNARTLRGLGMTCYEERSYVEAIDYLEQALASKTQPLTPKLSTEAQGILLQAKRFVTSALIEITPSGAKVSIDDQPAKLRSSGIVMLNPGEHSLQVSHPGYQTEHRTLHAEAGRELRVQIDLHSQESLQPTAASVQLAEPLPPPVQPQQQPQGPERYTLARQSPTAAAALSAVGLAGLATGWVFYALRDNLRVELWEFGLTEMQGFEQRKFSSFQERGGVAVAAASVGALAMSMAQYFWLPDQEPVPAWAWVAGGVGGAVALGAIGWAAFGRHCEVTDRLAFCRSTLSDELFAPMLALQALPLLSLPISYAVRERVPLRDANVSLRVSDGLQLSIAGKF